MTIRTVSGRTVTYEEGGVGRPLVLLHAYPLSREMWRPQVDSLSKDFHVLARICRALAAPAPLSASRPWMRWRSPSVNSWTRFDHRTNRVGGLSMGGYVAMAFARHFPDRLRAMILADNAAGIRRPGRQSESG